MPDAFIACMNIERFREALRSSKDEAQRQMLLTLIASEERKLGGMSLPEGGEAKDRGNVPMTSPQTRKSED
jgi:hypothetical protein